MGLTEVQRTLQPIIGTRAPTATERNWWVTIGRHPQTRQVAYGVVTNPARHDLTSDDSLWYPQDYRHPDRDQPPTVSGAVAGRDGLAFQRVTFGEIYDRRAQ